MSSYTQSTGLPCFQDAFGVPFASVKSEAVDYLNAGHRAPFSKTATLEKGKVSTNWVESFWPGQDPRHPTSKSHLVLKRNTDHPTCDTVAPVVLVRDGNITHAMGVQNDLRPGILGPSFEPVAGKIDDGHTIANTLRLELGEEIGLRPDPLFNNLRIMSQGLSAEKSDNCCARNTAITVALDSRESVFDPSKMPKNKPSPSEECVMSPWFHPAENLATEIEKSRARGVHTDAITGSLAVKFTQMENVLTRKSDGSTMSIPDALNVYGKQARLRSSIGSPGQQVERPRNVTLQRNEITHSLPRGTQIANVELDYNGPTAGKKTKVYPVSRNHRAQDVVAPIIRVGDEDHVMLVKRWQPGRGNGDQDSAFCLGFPTGNYKPDCTETHISRILSEYSPWTGTGKGISKLSTTGRMDTDAGLTDAGVSVIEILAHAPRDFPRAPWTSKQHPDCSTVFVPLNSINESVAQLTRNGTGVAASLDQYMTKISQLENAIRYKDPRITQGTRDWSHALPEVMNLHPELTQEAKDYEASFSQGDMMSR